MTDAFPDHFSRVATDYSTFRPHYPASLFEALAAVVPNRDCVWDCAAGTGQASVPLAERFVQVVATDASALQLARATPHPRVHYAAATASSVPLRAGSVSLVTVAQALHWFDVDAFYREVRRVLVPGGVLAVWSYGLVRVEGNAAVERLIDEFSERTLGAWWPAERQHVHAGYATLAFPFSRIALPAFDMAATWHLEHLLGYLGTWSSVSAKRRAEGTDPLEEFGRALRAAWGDAPTLVLRWPLTLLAGRVA